MKADAAERKTAKALAGAEAARDEAQRQHAAHALRQHLEKGEACPVCEQVVKKLPEAFSDVVVGGGLRV